MNLPHDDPLNRLTRDQVTSDPASLLNLSYDANGNRRSGNGSYDYLANTNRLTTTPVGSITLAAAGNTLHDGARIYRYNASRHLSEVAGTARYAYNAHRQRTRKTVGSDVTLYRYDFLGNLLPEIRADGTPIRDYVWADTTPIAQIEIGQAAIFLHTDRLNTARLAQA